MTIVAALVDEKNNIHMGCDSLCVVDHSINYYSSENFKVYKSNDFLMGMAGGSVQALMLVIDQLDLSEIGDYETPLSACIQYVLPKMKEILEENNLLFTEIDTNHEIGYCEYLIGYKGKLFYVTNGFQVVNGGNICAIGSGSQYALGSLYTNKSKSHKLRLQAAIECASYFDNSCGGDFHYFKV